MNIGFEAKRVFHNKTGLGNYSRDLIRILSKYYPDNAYLLYNPKTNKKNLFVANDVNVFEKNPTLFLFQKFKNLWRQFGVVNELTNDKIEIFHGLSGEIPYRLKSKKIKSVVTIHDLIFVKFPHLYSYWDRKIHYYKFKKAAQNADKIIAISLQTKNDIIENFKINPSKIEVIYQGCHAVFKQQFTDNLINEVVKKYNLPDKYILNVGTIETRKNVLLAVKAIKNIDVFLVIVGKETKYAAEVKRYILDNDLTHKVLFLKGLSLQELAILYQKASVFVYPSFYEGFGIPIIEALYSKTPVITNKSGVFSETAGPNSLYINPFDVDDLALKINLVLTDEALATKMKAEGLIFVQQFNDAVIAANIMDCYQKVLSA